VAAGNESLARLLVGYEMRRRLLVLITATRRLRWRRLLWLPNELLLLIFDEFLSPKAP
jgi:hypothetical protein